MPAFPAARVGDLHICSMTPPPGLPILPPCSINTIIGGMPAARVTDLCACVGPPPANVDPIVTGSPTVLINNLPAARMTDKTAKAGTIVTGCPNVLIGVMSSPVVPSSSIPSMTPPAMPQADQPAPQPQSSPAAEGKEAEDPNKVKFKLEASQEHTYFSPIDSPGGKPEIDRALEIGVTKPLFRKEFFKTEFGNQAKGRAKSGKDPLIRTKGSLRVGAFDGDAQLGLKVEKDKFSVAAGAKASFSTLQLKGEAAMGAGDLAKVEGEFNYMAASAKAQAGYFHSKEEKVVKGEIGVEAVAIEGKAGGTISITPYSIWNNSFGRVFRKAPKWMDHGIVIGAEGALGVGAAAKANASFGKHKDGYYGFRGSAKVGAGPMAGFKFILGVK